MGDYRELDAWANARKLAVAVYKQTAKFPVVERFGLIGQMRRAAISVASNIAEAHGRGPSGDRVQFLLMARGSMFELQTQALISGDLGYIPAEHAEAMVKASVIIGKQLSSLIRHYRTQSPP
ncbi:MAG TPA: four helix bundle protein [Thermoanaerobaculia bacterium]|nr:four helix bundle protein [Thermoanaerobaculia bacterium]